MSSQKQLVCIIGPTAVGKTDLSIKLALKLNTEIISCDSRQMYREMRIGTAVPSASQLTQVKHYFIRNISIHDYYSVYEYELDALKQLDILFRNHDQVVLTGGSGLYLDALLYGMDEIPDPDPTIRQEIIKRFEDEGIEALRFELKRLDPEYYNSTDIRNPKRIMRGLEVCMSTGQPFSQFRIRKTEKRSFNSTIICLDRERSMLHQSINQRVDMMIDEGLETEAHSLYPFRETNALKTVGYRELFQYFDGDHSLNKAIDLIKRNSRRYARRQISWNKKYKNAIWINLDGTDLDNPLKQIVNSL